jgi:uncharacterized tellurite resistance protein B-like protein
MMSIFEWFLSARPAESSIPGDTDTVRRIVRELDKLDPGRARYLAAFAYVLSRVAGADFHVSDAERAKMVDLVKTFGDLPEEQALLVVEIANGQHRLFGGTENFLVTREFRQIASDRDRQMLLECLFAVSAADEAISSEEEAQIRQIASELGFEHAEYVRVRMAYSAKRNVLKK